MESVYKDQHVLPLMNKELENDLKRFSSVESAVQLDELRNKRFGNFLIDRIFF